MNEKPFSLEILFLVWNAKGRKKTINLTFGGRKWPVWDPLFDPNSPPEKVDVGPFLRPFPGNEAYHFFGGPKSLCWKSLCVFLSPKFIFVRTLENTTPHAQKLFRLKMSIRALSFCGQREAQIENAPTCYRAPRWPDPEFPQKIPIKDPRPEILDSRI